jgi:glyoxylase-like metal-dependent hydrolase (beta-lactamase superfamily II)/8-oxo-dGTP pyrophosphatase MutT (NUDIX family)
LKPTSIPFLSPERKLMSSVVTAASVLLARGARSLEVFAIRRSSQLRFFGGFIAFPGGCVDPDDGGLLHITAARELFEETGVLVADLADHSSLPDLRQELLAKRLRFSEILSRLNVIIDPRSFTPIGRLVTPPFASARFDTTFFIADLPQGQQAEVWPGELDQGFWSTTDDLLTSWTKGECLVSPPTVSLLEAFRHRPVRDIVTAVRPLLASLDHGALPPIYFAPAVQMLPLLAPALAPLTHTNVFLIGTGPTLLIDPGAVDPDEQRRLCEVLDGRPPSEVVLTHHHPDHIGSANLVAQRYGVPIAAHPWTAEKLRGRIEVSHLVNDGDTLDLGPAPDGHGRWHLQVLFTPGHAPGHLAFWEPRYRLLFAGDMVSTLSSVIVAPPDGDLTLYLDSLRTLTDYDARLLLPAHGSPTPRSRQTLQEAIAHRRKREEQLLQALSIRPRTIEDLCAEIYSGLPGHLRRFAELQIEAGLIKLEREGFAVRDGVVWIMRQFKNKEDPVG